MTEPVIETVVLDGNHDWTQYELPGSNKPMQFVRLRNYGWGAHSGIARFPEGWERPGVAYADVDEDFVVTGGSLEINGVAFEPLDWAFIESKKWRRATRSNGVTTTVAHFTADPWWTAFLEEGEDSGEAPDTPIVKARIELGDRTRPSPLGPGRSISLRESSNDASWIVDPPFAGHQSPVDVELIDPIGGTWRWIPKGATFPRFAGTCFCRTFPSAKEEG